MATTERKTLIQASIVFDLRNEKYVQRKKKAKQIVKLRKITNYYSKKKKREKMQKSPYFEF